MTDRPKHNSHLYKILSFVLVMAILVFANGVFRSGKLVRDVENRWQRFFYDVRISLPIPPDTSDYPLYLIELDDKSLPEGTCRSPVDKIWLNAILEAASRQKPVVVGLNLNLTDKGTPADAGLAKSIGSLENVILLDHNGVSDNNRYSSAAKGRGSMVYRENSSGDIQFVCGDVSACVCSGNSDCNRTKTFFGELVSAVTDEPIPDHVLDNEGWIKIFSQYPERDFLSESGPWHRLSAAELLRLPADSLPAGSIMLIGARFQGLYPQYRLQARNLSSTSIDESPNQITDLDLLALVVEMVLNRTFLREMSPWLEGLALLTGLVCIALVAVRRISLLPLLLSAVLCLAWNSIAALVFSFYLIEIRSVLPCVILFGFSFYCIGYQQITMRLERLELKGLLEKERFNGLVDRFHSHSVFNALEHIRYLVRIGDTGAERYILDYSTLLLDDLRHSPQQSYPVKEQWDYVINYLQLQNLKLKGRLEITGKLTKETEAQLDSNLIPWKLFYPLVENAFKQTKALVDVKDGEKPEIRLELSTDRNILSFTVFNSYSDQISPSGAGQGLNNLKRRLAVIFPKGGWKLETTVSEKTWIAALSVPMVNKQAS